MLLCSVYNEAFIGKLETPSLMASALLGDWSVLSGHFRCLWSHSCRRLICTVRSFLRTVLHKYRRVAASTHPFWFLLIYFVANSCAGFLLLKNLQRKKGLVGPRNLDLFFMAVSAATVSSMSTMQMEGFSRSQVFVLILLMLAGGEAFTALLRLHLSKAQIMVGYRNTGGDSNFSSSSALELPVAAMDTRYDMELRYKSINLLSMSVFVYTTGAISLGSAAIIIYLASSRASDARDVLHKKGIPILDFSVFLSVSSFTNCGFVLTNENMIPFRKNSSLLLLIIPLVLAGNSLFPPCLRCLLWSFRRVLGSRRESIDDLLGLADGKHLGFNHLFGNRRCFYLVLTTFVLIVLQTVFFVFMEWDSDVLRGSGMSAWQKTAAVLFQSVNSRHAGESVFDLSVLSPAVLVLYVLMMYLPPYTSFSPGKDERGEISGSQPGEERWKNSDMLLWKNLILSHLGYISVFVIAVCVTERRKLAQDPLNFNVFSILFEVVSAYGNVGLSMGYSCGRRLETDGVCKDEWFGFAGWWSDGGKVVLIVVMLVGRLKRFNTRGGSAWKLT